MKYSCLLTCIKRLKKGYLRKGGRNNLGRITAYHRGGGLKRTYRFVDYWRRLNLQGVVLAVLKDSFRNCLMAFVLYQNGIASFILSVDQINEGSLVWSGVVWAVEKNEVKWPWNVRAPIPLGSAISLGLCPIGAEVCNIEIKPGQGGQLCRSAGSFAIVIKKDAKSKTVVLKLRSGWFFRVSFHCYATLGIMSNASFKFFVKGSAGYNRNFGKRPVVRGVAMNPIDHPHGGGEGKASGGKLPKTPWGLGTKGRKTVSKRSRFKKRFFRFK